MSDDTASNPLPPSPPSPPDPTPAAAPPAPPARPARPSRAAWLSLLFMLVLPVALCTPLCFVDRGPSVASSTILELDLDQPLDEAGEAGAMALFAFEGRPLIDTIAALERAKADPRVKGLVARVGSGQSLATVQELREAIASFRAAGKTAIAWTDTFGEVSPAVGAYVLATAFDEIWLQPSGDVNLSGLFSEGVFLKGLLDKLGVEPQFSGRKEYKNAVNQFTETTYTEPHRASMVALLQSLTDQIVDDIVASRPRLGDRAAVRALLLGGALSAQEALARGLVDKLGYRDEVVAALEARFGADARRMYVARYGETEGGAWEDTGSGDVIALVVASGQVARGTDSVDPLSGDRTFGSDTTSAALRAAARDNEVRAILLRVDSPGGSYIASDTIRREVERAQAQGKPVIVSMGDLAASGGYFVGMGADRILANRATITGSIGVFAGKFVLKGLLDKIGVSVQPVTASADVDPTFFSSTEGYSERARAQLEKTLDRIYLDFTSKAAAGRKMSLEQLEPLARGRIWTGAEARANKLVDDNGGFLRAVEVARGLAGVPEGRAVRLRAFPAPRPPLEQLLAAVRGDQGDNSDDVQARLPQLRAGDAVRALRALVQAVIAPLVRVDPVAGDVRGVVDGVRR